MKPILNILAVLAAAVFLSSCGNTTPTVVNRVEGNSAPVSIVNNVTINNNQFASIDAGGHPFRDEGRGIMRYTAPKGFNILPKLPRGCSEVVRNGHRVAIGRDGRCHGVLPPHNYCMEGDGHYRYRPPVKPSRLPEWRGDRERGYARGGYNNPDHPPGYEKPRKYRNWRDNVDTGPGNPRPITYVTPIGETRGF